MTSAPSFAKAKAVALPIPCAAAVTTIFLFFNLPAQHNSDHQEEMLNYYSDY